MNIEKAKKRIAKQVKKGVNGYPKITLEYFGETTELATDVVISFILEEHSEVQEQKFVNKSDVREDETIQSMIVKIIERADAATVTQVDGVSLIK